MRGRIAERAGTAARVFIGTRTLEGAGTAAPIVITCTRAIAREGPERKSQTDGASQGQEAEEEFFHIASDG
jgi:hypothetical protein